eukprot:TRINITY_DN15393_c0_g1_i2.p1 TRINITY_DN15393_c0_g1~~TRINITY_DN15393_c0_g1_i2.p1  ORF type:complete len:153 (-),score=38.80 TRINITY_DN15393_c0_g1_i2:105-563(-)
MSSATAARLAYQYQTANFPDASAAFPDVQQSRLRQEDRERRRRSSGDDVNSEEEDEEASEQALEQVQSRNKRKKGEKLEVSEWLDDLLEGFAEIYRLSISGGAVFITCVRKVAYPIKEAAVSSFDNISGTTQEANPSRTSSHYAPTFAQNGS